MRNKIPALVQDIALATRKHTHWVAEAKNLLHTAGPASPETQKALSLARMWAEELEAKQDELDLEADGQDIEFNTEFAVQD